MRSTPNRVIVRYSVLLMAALATPLHAQQGGLPHGPTDAEMMTLPPYCHARMREDQNAKRSWEQRMGREQFVHVHHHCLGLNFLTRASAEFDTKRRRYLLQRAVANFNYVLARWPANFALTAEARNYKMQAEAQLAQY